MSRPIPAAGGGFSRGAVEMCNNNGRLRIEKNLRGGVMARVSASHIARTAKRKGCHARQGWPNTLQARTDLGHSSGPTRFASRTEMAEDAG